MSESLLELRRIVQYASHAASPDEQAQRIVDAVCEAIGTDICSLYALDGDANLLLLASHGLNVRPGATVPRGAGLVGLVARSHHPVNLADAALHPEYHHLAGSKEEDFPGFCGVPVVTRGESVGVLVVQTRQARTLGPDHVAFVETLAAHLALLLKDTTLPLLTQSRSDVRAKGISGAPGIGIGRARLADPARLANVTLERCEDVDREVSSFRELIRATAQSIKDELGALSSRVSADTSSIFDAYGMLLQDQSLIDHVEAQIHDGFQVPAALKLSIGHFSDLFFAMEDPYLRARHEDIRHLGNKLYRVWLSLSADRAVAEDINEPVVLIGEALSVSDIANLPPGKLAAIACSDGSSLSHIAVLANALGIPAVMGMPGVGDLRAGELLIVDGTAATVINKPSASLLREYQETLQSHRQLENSRAGLRDLPAATLDGVHVALLANTGLQEDLMPGIANGAEGIGLYRTEIPFMIRQNLPTEEEQVVVYRKVLDAYPGSPVYIRTLDVGADKPLPYLPASNEDNPALGLRGIRFTLDNVQLLTTQLRAIIRAAGDRTDVRVLFPMVSATAELDSVYRVVDDVLLQLKAEGLAHHKPLLGVMVEVPAVISLLPFWKGRIDFVSVGTNDLSQYLLAIDRNNPLVANLYESVHPSVLREIMRVVDYCLKEKLPLCICGEMASDPVAVLLLLGMGVTQLSMSSSKIPIIKSLIRMTSTRDSKALLASALKLDNPVAIRAVGMALLERLGFEARVH